MPNPHANEDKFRNKFQEKYGVGSLAGEKRYPSQATADMAEISCDLSLEDNGRLVLIEVDSCTTTKPVVGQYVLLNGLCNRDLSKTLFLVIHYAKDFNPQRTRKYLQFVRQMLGERGGLRYAAFTSDDFFKICKRCDTVAELVVALFKIASDDPA